MESRTEAVEHLLRDHCAVGVRAPPGSGETLIFPEAFCAWSPTCIKAVLLAEPTRYAAQKLVDSFVYFRKWDRRRIQLRTGSDQRDEFWEGYTQLSVVTYGMLWRWLTGDTSGCDRLVRRYKGFLLDEFAKVVTQPGDTEIMPPSDR